MNTRYNAYWASYLDKDLIEEIAKSLVTHTSIPTNFQVTAEGDVFEGWLLAERMFYREEQYGQYDYVKRMEEKHRYFVDKNGLLLKSVTYWVNDAGETIEESGVLNIFLDEDYYFFDCPTVEINQMVGKNQDCMYVNNLRYDKSNPYYTHKGEGIKKLLYSIFGRQ